MASATQGTGANGLPAKSPLAVAGQITHQNAPANAITLAANLTQGAQQSSVNANAAAMPAGAVPANQLPLPMLTQALQLAQAQLALHQSLGVKIWVSKAANKTATVHLGALGVSCLQTASAFSASQPLMARATVRGPGLLPLR